MTQDALATARLSLVPLSDDHLDFEVALDADPSVMRYLGEGVPRGRDEVERRHTERLASAKDGLGFWAGFVDGEFAGWWLLEATPDDARGPAEVGYRLLPAFWGRGLASEGAAALLDHGFRRLDLPKIFAETMAVNTASRAVMSRLGMRHVATRGEGAVGAVEGSAQGVVDYVITRAEWLAGRGRPAAAERGIAQRFTGEQIAGTVVIVASSDPDWPRQYRSAAADLLAALGARITAIEHIGSTAVPGLVAKPIIDIAARAAPGVDPFSLHDAIDALGYRPHTAGPKNHAVFVKSAGSERSHLLHVFADDQWDTCNQRLFRDKLLHDESARRRYAELKVALASSATDGKQYTAGKRALVEELLHEEQAARGLPLTSAWEK